jgi:hypothetical protein
LFTSGLDYHKVIPVPGIAGDKTAAADARTDNAYPRLYRPDPSILGQIYDHGDSSEKSGLLTLMRS